MVNRYFLNRIDEKGRFLGLKVYLGIQVGQDDTHTYSYMFSREQLGKPALEQSTEEFLKLRDLEMLLKDDNN